MHINLRDIARFNHSDGGLVLGADTTPERTVELELLLQQAAVLTVETLGCIVGFGVPAGYSKLVFLAEGSVEVIGPKAGFYYATEEEHELAYEVTGELARVFTRVAPDEDDALDQMIIDRLAQRMRADDLRRARVKLLQEQYVKDAQQREERAIQLEQEDAERIANLERDEQARRSAAATGDAPGEGGTDGDE